MAACDSFLSFCVAAHCFIRSATWSFTDRIRMTASLACVTLSRICSASVNCSTRSASVTPARLGFREIVNDCVCVSPAAVSRTW